MCHGPTTMCTCLFHTASGTVIVNTKCPVHGRPPISFDGFDALNAKLDALGDDARELLIKLTPNVKS